MKLIALLAAGLSIFLGGVAQAALLGVRYSGLRTSQDIIRIDEVNHTVTVLGSSGTVFMNSLARDSQGWFWTAAPSTNPGLPLSDNYLLRINPLTGQTTNGPKLIPTALSDTGYRALAFSPDGVLYGLAVNDHLVRINMSTGAATYIGRLGVLGQPIGIQGMAFAPDGILYGWGVERFGLIRINPTDATFQDVNAASGPADVQALTVSPSGTMYAARDTLWTVNTSSGIRTTVMSGLGDVRGIDLIIPLVVPEPAAEAQLCALAACVFVFRRNARLAHIGPAKHYLIERRLATARSRMTKAIRTS